MGGRPQTRSGGCSSCRSDEQGSEGGNPKWEISSGSVFPPERCSSAHAFTSGNTSRYSSACQLFPSQTNKGTGPQCYRIHARGHAHSDGLLLAWKHPRTGKRGAAFSGTDI